MIKKFLAFFSSLALLLFLPSSAFADSVAVNFENPPYVTGSINGQDGWTALGSAGSGCALYDQAVVTNTFGYASFAGQSFRISDAVTSGCFGDQAFAKPLANSVGEADATAGTFSAGTKQVHFETQFDIASTVPGAQQPGLHVSISPDRGDGSRMSYLRFEDGVSGINVFFVDVQGTTNPADFVETQVGSGLDRTVPHTVKLTMDVADGPSNDVVKVYIDGVLVHTGTSWENYYRFDSEASAEQSPRIVKTVIFRSAGGAVPADAGKGFLFDNYSAISGPTPKLVFNDFDGNGKKDLGVFQLDANGLGSWYFKDLPTVQWGRSGDVIVPADYNGDLKTDIAVWQNSGGTNRTFYVRNQSSVQHGHDGDKPVPADYDGDGKADLAVWTPSTKVWDIILSTTNQHTTRQWGHSDDTPVPADYDGDGKADIAVWENSGGTNRTFYIVRSSDNGETAVQLGNDGDIPVPGDYNGDDQAEAAVWRPSDGTWRINGSQPIAWGHAGDVPVPGDYNGNGTWDVANWQSRGDGTRTWYVKDQFNFDLGRDADVPF